MLLCAVCSLHIFWKERHHMFCQTLLLRDQRAPNLRATISQMKMQMIANLWFQELGQVRRKMMANSLLMLKKDSLRADLRTLGKNQKKKLSLKTFSLKPMNSLYNTAKRLCKSWCKAWTIRSKSSGMAASQTSQILFNLLVITRSSWILCLKCALPLNKNLNHQSFASMEPAQKPACAQPCVASRLSNRRLKKLQRPANLQLKTQMKTLKMKKLSI
jgi:hypothetical protein